MDHHHPKLDYDRLTPLIYMGTNACCSSHFDESLLKKGVRADISLEEKRVDTPYGIEFYVWLPTKNHSSPMVEQLAFGVNALKFFADNNVKCYVHCKNGHGRAPTLAAAYFIAHENMTAEEAISFVKKKRSGAHIEPVQREALLSLEKNLRGGATLPQEKCC